MADEPKHEKNLPEKNVGEKGEKKVGEKPEKNVGEMQKGERPGEKERGAGELGRQGGSMRPQPQPAQQAKPQPTKPPQVHPPLSKGHTEGAPEREAMTCENCGESFTTEQAMAEHTREQHAGTSGTAPNP